jgi:uncharacterized protein (TIGR03000 family)
VEITLRVPDGASVWFDGAATKQKGTTRVFVSPALHPGRDYSYDVRVQWQDEGGMVERTRHLKFQAGDHIRVDYTGRGVIEVRGFADEAPSSPPAPAANYRYVPQYYYVPRYYPTPAASPDRPRFYDPNNYPPPGGPPGHANGVGQG